MVTPIKVLIFNDLHKYFNTYFADYQQVNHKLNELLIENKIFIKPLVKCTDESAIENLKLIDYGNKTNNQKSAT